MNDDFNELKETAKEPNTNKNLILAIVLVVVGSGLLIGNLTGYAFKNWWALFMLIPAGSMLMGMWYDYQENGRFTRKSSGMLASSIILLTMIAIFLFDLSWVIFWPISLIAAGLGILIGSRE